MKLDNLKILLVEDDLNTRSTIRAMLAEIGIHQVFEATNGHEADQFIEIEAADIDMVISDWNMPEKTGLDLLLNLRIAKPNMPFIMVTGRADSNSVHDAVTAGVTSYIRKPFSIKELESKITAAYKKGYE